MSWEWWTDFVSNFSIRFPPFCRWCEWFCDHLFLDLNIKIFGMMNKVWHIDSRNNSYTVTECDRARGSIHYIDKSINTFCKEKNRRLGICYLSLKKRSAKKVRWIAVHVFLACSWKKTVVKQKRTHDWRSKLLHFLATRCPTQLVTNAIKINGRITG
jgi:hypothetical protein